MDNFSRILRFINNDRFDLKAEVILANLIQMGASSEEIIVSFLGQHKRSWSKDVKSVETIDFNNRDQNIVVYINQDGIYDALPEGLFHSTQYENIDSGQEMANESRNLRNEEKDIRAFFMPFENAIFSEKVKLASYETNILKNIHYKSLTGLIPDFWKVDNSIPKKYLKTLISLLPIAHKIIGDFDLTAISLSYVLGEKIEIEACSTSENNSHEDDIEVSLPSLGDCVLGVTLVCGQLSDYLKDQILVKIGPLKNTSAQDCLKSGPIFKTLNSFYDYFIPMELDVVTQFKLDNINNYFVTSDNDGTTNSYLGLNSVL